MQVTNLRVSFLREKQPVQYEKAQPAVEFAAVLEDGEDHMGAARKLMLEAATVVYAGIGYAVPDKVAQALAAGEIPAGGTVVTKKVETAVPAASVKGPSAEQDAETPKRGRGRPKGSKNTGPKAGSKAAQEKEAAQLVANTSDIPGGDTPQNISTGGERVDPENPTSSVAAAEVPELQTTDVPSAESAPTGEGTAKDFQTAINSAVKDGKLSIQKAKQLMAHFKVARARDLTPQQVTEGQVMLNQMISESAA